MNILSRIDRWAILNIEAFCHWFQRKTGKNNYFLLKISHFTFVALMLGVAPLTEKFELQPPPILSIVLTILPIFSLVIAFSLLALVFWIIPRMEKIHLECLSREPQFSEEVHFFMRRMRMLAVTILVIMIAFTVFNFPLDGNILSVGIDILTFLLIMSVFFLPACNPLLPEDIED